MNSIRLISVCVLMMMVTAVCSCKSTVPGTSSTQKTNQHNIPFSVTCRFAEKSVHRDGDLVYVLVRSKQRIFADLEYKSEKGTYNVIKRNAPSRRFRVKNQEDTQQPSTSYFVRFVWRIPEFSTESLIFKLSVATTDGRKSEKIINTTKLIDSVTPSSTATFNPFSVER